jgi:hypothetical protein
MWWLYVHFTIDLYMMSYVFHGVIFSCSSSVHFVVDVMK